MQESRALRVTQSIASGIAFFLLAYLVFAYFSLGNKPWIFFTSDTLYIPYLYQDIFLQGGKLTQWKFSPVPYFFPDFTLYSLIALVVRNLKWAIVLFGVAQLGMLYVLIVSIGKLLAGKKNVVLFRLSVLMALLLLASGHFQQETLEFALVSQEHFGGALMFLLNLYLIIRNFRHESKWNYILLGIVSFLTIFSDIVFVTQFFAPVMASLVMMLLLVEGHLKKVCKRTMAVVTVSVLASYFFYRMRLFSLHMSINPHLLSRTHYAEYKIVTLRILQNLTDYYQHNAIFMLLYVIFVFVTTGLIAKLLVVKAKSYLRARKSGKGAANCNVFKENGLFAADKLFLFTMLLLYFAIVMGYISLLLTDNDVLMPGSNGMRHYQPFLLFPVLLGVPLYLAKYTNIGTILSKHYVLLLVAIVSTGFLFVTRGSVSAILNYYPPAVACLDNTAKAYHFQNGIADYWDAKSYTFLSKQQMTSAAVEIDHVTHDINSFLWMNTMHDYVGKEFTFVIVNGGLKTPDHYAIVMKKFGVPLLKLQCPSYVDPAVSNEIYLYQKGVINKGIVIGY